ncbi:MAG: hypothetical protein MOGMAGMI_00350 [Candidatus Omnitrophica bacterium]|nr:hypothetical protein [Candidatus Omnitrophota bacterium]
METKGDLIVSKLEEQLKELTLRKAKVDLLKDLKEITETYLQDTPLHEKQEAASEVKEIVKGLFESVIDSLENSKEISALSKGGDFSEEEVSLLKTLLNKVKQTTSKSLSQEEEAFKAKFSSFLNKRVKFNAPAGKVNKGLIIDLQAPFVLIEDDLGEIVKYLPETVYIYP